MTQETRNPARLVAASLAAILLAAVALRVAGLAYGLPAVYNPDEVSILSRALAFAKGDLNPHNFLYPSFYFYLLFGWVGTYFVLARVVGTVASLQAFQAQFFTDPTNIYLAARTLGVVCGAATVVAVFVLGRRLFGRAAGLCAAFFLAVAPVHVIDSHYVKHDVAATLAIVAALVAVVSVYPLRPRRAGPWPAAVAGAACGVALSIHYYAVFLALPLALAVMARYRAKSWRLAGARLAAAAAAMAAVFLLLSPFLLVDAGTAWRDIVANREIVVDRARALEGGVIAGAGRYLRLLWLDAVGFPVAALSVLGAVMLAWRAWRHAVILLAFPVVFLLFIGNTVPASRYLNPVIPFLALLGAYAVVRIAAITGERVRWIAVLALAFGAALPAVNKSIRADEFFTQTDTRTLAQRFLEAHVPANAGVAVQPYSVQLWPSRDSLREALLAHLGTLDAVPQKFAIQLRLEPYPAGYRLVYIGDGGLDADKIYVTYAELGGSRGLTALRARGVQYVVVKRYNDPQPATLLFLDALAHEGRRMAVFTPYRSDASPGATAAVEPYLHNTDARIQEPLERPGPIVEIWQLNELGPPTH
jgi:4-amino-4-deoxy-L-arabinose transferase-like glycosyltransferase